MKRDYFFFAVFELENKVFFSRCIKNLSIHRTRSFFAIFSLFGCGGIHSDMNFDNLEFLFSHFFIVLFFFVGGMFQIMTQVSSDSFNSLIAASNQAIAIYVYAAYKLTC